MKVRSLLANELYIDFGDMEGEMFKVYRSTSPKNDFDLLADSVLFPFYVDESVNLFENGLRYYYKVEGYIGASKVSESFAETLKYNSMDNVARKVIYESRVVLKVMNNPPVQILLKKRVGDRCPECWNPITKKTRFANCKVCNGTGILTGYHTPISALISRDFSVLMDSSNMLDGDNVSLTGVSAWITNKPLLSPGDVIVDITNQRFHVDQVVQRTRSQFIIRQILNLVPLEKGHPVYNVDVDWSRFIE